MCWITIHSNPFLCLLISEYMTTARRSCEIKPHHNPILPRTLPFISGIMSPMPNITVSTMERTKRNRRNFNLFMRIRIYRCEDSYIPQQFQDTGESQAGHPGSCCGFLKGVSYLFSSPKYWLKLPRRLPEWPRRTDGLLLLNQRSPSSRERTDRQEQNGNRPR